MRDLSQIPMLQGLKARMRNTWPHPLHIANRTLRAAMAFSRNYATGKLLDIGCGNKPYRDVFVGIIAYAGIELPGNSAQSRVVDVYDDGSRLPFAGASFDTVLCNEVIEHVAQP